MQPAGSVKAIARLVIAVSTARIDQRVPGELLDADVQMGLPFPCLELLSVVQRGRERLLPGDQLGKTWIRNRCAAGIRMIHTTAPVMLQTPQHAAPRPHARSGC